MPVPHLQEQLFDVGKSELAGVMLRERMELPARYLVALDCVPFGKVRRACRSES
jgi:hypothetical protein